MYPLKLKPALKDYIWGGNKLKKDFNIKSDKSIVAEAWELSTHKDGSSIILNGELKDKTFAEALNIWGLEANCPILIKLIDAKENLSVQVHPNDEYAERVENSKGKTEMWYVVDCEENAALTFGFIKDMDKDEFCERIQNNSLTEVLNKVPVKKGDVFFIEAGTIHSIGAGMLIAEIQQNSNITYRVYDFGRVDANGKSRELHIDKAIEVTNLKKAKDSADTSGETIQKSGYTETTLAKCKYFNTKKLNIDTKAELPSNEQSFNSLLILEGEGVIKFDNETLNFSKGDSFYIPQSTPAYTIEGKSEIILTSL